MHGARQHGRWPGAAMVTSRYVIVLDGEVDATCAVAFAPAELSVGNGRTTIHTEAIDQPALYGILDRVAGLGLTLLSVASTGMTSEHAVASRPPRATRARSR